MVYTIPYILLILFYAILAWYYETADKDDSKWHIILMSVVMFVFFFGFRGFCFYDWDAYYPAFQRYTLTDLYTLPREDWPFEPGFTVLMMLSKSLFNNYHFFVLLCNLIDTFLLMRFLSRRVDNIPLALMICISMNGLGLFTDLMRNSITILIFANAIELIEQRRFIPYVLICVASATIHSSALFYIPLYFFIHRRLNKWVYLGLFIAGNIVFLFHIPVFLTLVDFVASIISPDLQYKIEEYTSMMPGASFGISIGYLERLFTGGIVFCYLDKLRQQREDNDIFINSLLMYLMLFFLFSEFKVISLRFSNLFSYAYWIIWMDLIKCFSITNNKRLYLAFITIYCVFKMYGSSNYIIARYDNVLLGAQPFHIREYIFNKHANDF